MKIAKMGSQRFGLLSKPMRLTDMFNLQTVVVVVVAAAVVVVV